ERPSLVSVSPDFYLSPVGGFRNLTTDCRRRFFFSTRPSSLFSKNIVEPSDVDVQTEISFESEVNSLAEKFFPTIFAIGSRRIGSIFPALGIIRIFLIVSGVHAGR